MKKSENKVERIILDSSKPGVSELIEIIKEYEKYTVKVNCHSKKHVVTWNRRDKSIGMHASLIKIPSLKNGLFKMHKSSRNSSAVI